MGMFFVVTTHAAHFKAKEIVWIIRKRKRFVQGREGDNPREQIRLFSYKLFETQIVCGIKG